MTNNKKIMTILILVMAVGVIGTVHAYHNSFFGVDCDVFSQGTLHQTCNDLNNLNDRLTVVENTPEHSTRTSITDIITVNGESTYGHVASCPVGTNITNVGYIRTDQILPPITEPGLDLSTSYQQNDSDWVLSFANPTDGSIDVHVKYSCLG